MFSRITAAYNTYFWNIFGYGKPEYANIVMNHTYSGDNGTSSHMPEHKLTEIVGYLIISSYFIVAVVVLLNMLIAMMANSYNAITVSCIIFVLIYVLSYHTIKQNKPISEVISKLRVAWCLIVTYSKGNFLPYITALYYYLN